MKLKLSFLLAGGILLSLLCFVYTYPTKIEASWAASEELDKDDEIEEALAEFLSKVLEEQVKAQGDVGENELADSEGFSSLLRGVRRLGDNVRSETHG